MRETKEREGMKGDGDRVSRTGLKRLKIREKEEKRGRKRKRAVGESKNGSKDNSVALRFARFSPMG